MGDILSNYDILGAFWMTIKLSVLGTVGALVLGTVLAVMRVSPVTTLRAIGTSYVNVFRNTPLTLLMVASILGMTYILGMSLSDDQQTNIFRWAVIVLSVYHAAFICEAVRSGFNTVPVGQAEAARSIGLSFGQSLTQVILPQAVRGSIAPVGSTIIALIKNSTVASVIGVSDAAGMMATIVENETGTFGVFLIFAVGFVILTLPLGMAFTAMSRRLAVRR
ncbi:Putative Glutamate transport system permease protein gluC [Nostocoides japonicum T1-X7]|uniref:Putative Glutamate transport system permease protein gluC n=1 Tax=Nostocoides japonicum T1-X7 TaxID=1194083 RepID=A0A077LXD8_9MICO|nr:amino acid ABC transporter permease [Tetrasphaera japonica]CCH78568.1 Putative Glutamate transport system permease protein gluC [Tetrasphaera japonica T1-X7]